MVDFQCAEKYKVPWKLILNCAKGVEGNWFLKKYGELTVKLKPRMTFVPTILLNQVNAFLMKFFNLFAYSNNFI